MVNKQALSKLAQVANRTCACIGHHGAVVIQHPVLKPDDILAKRNFVISNMGAFSVDLTNIPNSKGEKVDPKIRITGNDGYVLYSLYEINKVLKRLDDASNKNRRFKIDKRNSMKREMVFSQEGVPIFRENLNKILKEYEKLKAIGKL